MRFDEVELQAVPLGTDEAVAAPPPPHDAARTPGLKRFLALLTDLSLFAALALALSPLLPDRYAWPELTALGGFVLIISYYYFVGAWMLWGKTIGGAIFDVRVETHTLREASLRWLRMLLMVTAIAIAAAVVIART